MAVDLVELLAPHALHDCFSMPALVGVCLVLLAHKEQ